MEGTLSQNVTPEELSRVLATLRSDTVGGRQVGGLERLVAFRKLVESGKLRTLVPLLPLILNLDGKPYVLDDFFPMETLFQTQLPRNLMIKAGRQVAKSSSLATRAIAISNIIPNFKTLFITPLCEQIQRFSSNYVGKFINQSPVKALWVNTKTDNRVLQRSFKNGSVMTFSFALLDADRTRGIPSDCNNYDELQDLDPAHLPIIGESMSASPWRLTMKTGTPKTLDNAVEGEWEVSSQAEWMIPCGNCGKENYPRAGLDLERMIGPYSDAICEQRPGVVCAAPGCGLPVHPRQGRWVHRYKERRWTYPGYHIPQVIMPMHYADKERWAELLAKRQGRNNTTAAKFYNEVLGESYDVGAKLVSQTDLQRAACLPWENRPEPDAALLARARQYPLRVLAVDWGGGGEARGGGSSGKKGQKEMEKMTTSFTVLAVLGFRPDGVIDVLYGRRLLTPHNHVAEAIQMIRVHRMFDCHLMCHDYTGAGALRETIAIQAGMPEGRTVPVSYVRSASRSIMVYKEKTDIHPRNYWQVDKTRSLVLTCNCIKLGLIRFFKYDHENKDNPGLLHDFLSLVENKTPTRLGSDIYTVVRNPMFPDDFAQAVNIGCCTIWQRTKSWPNLATLAGLQLTVAQMQSAGPDDPWSEERLMEGFRPQG